jgi:DNA-binding response OmpR family regulator
MTNEKAILLAFKDAEELESIAKKLKDKDEGYKLISARDGARVIESTLNNVPSLIIVDLELPVIGGERVFKILRNNPNTSNVPFLFLSDKDEEVEGFKIGKDAFLKRPFKWEELYSRLRQTALSKTDDTRSIGTKEIEGRLSQMSLVDLLQILHLNKKEGELEITSQDSVGTIYIKNGQIYNAVLSETEKEKALFRLLRWKEGTFAFHPRPVDSSQQIQSSTGNLLMEGMRQIDEFEKAKHLFPDSNSLLKTRVDTATLPKGLKHIIYEILVLADFYPRTGDLVDHCTFPDYEAYNTIHSLINRGLLDVAKRRKKGKDASTELVTPAQAIKIKEKVISRWADMLSVNFGKIFIASTSSKLSKDFIHTCTALPGFSINPKITSSPHSKGERIGEIGTLKLFGGLEVILFSVPTSQTMAPLLNAFSCNLIGLLLLWREESARELSQLVGTKNNILSCRRVPVIHIFGGSEGIDRKLSASFKKTFNLKHDEPLFIFKEDEGVVIKMFKSFFDQLTKEDYVTSGAFTI